MVCNRKRIIWTALILLAVFVVGGLLGYKRFLQAYPHHEHCIKIAGTAFRLYASDHGGKLPFHTNGFGDALLLLVKEDYTTIAFITGPKDDGNILSNALKMGLDVPEDKCSRVYIQGLSETNDPNIAILFDKHPTRGGDHFPSPWKAYVREICLLDGSMQVIRESEWKVFSQKQIKLLVEVGVSRTTAEMYYHND